MQRFTFPVSVMLERREIQRSGWSVPHWELLGVVSGQPGAASASGPQVVRDEDQRVQILWGGLTLELYKDESENYWHNLMAGQPLIFVVCRPPEDDESNEYEMRPALVSVNGDDASAHTEAEDLVLSAPMPAEIYRWVEAFVLEHFQPGPRKVRKRKNWTEDEGEQRQPRT